MAKFGSKLAKFGLTHQARNYTYKDFFRIFSVDVEGIFGTFLLHFLKIVLTSAPFFFVKNLCLNSGIIQGVAYKDGPENIFA